MARTISIVKTVSTPKKTTTSTQSPSANPSTFGQTAPSVGTVLNNVPTPVKGGYTVNTPTGGVSYATGTGPNPTVGMSQPTGKISYDKLGQPISQQTTGVVRPGNTMTDAELSKIPMEQRPNQINQLTGQEMMAAQLTTEEASPGSAYSLQAAATSIGGAALTSSIPAILSSAEIAVSAAEAYFTSIGTKALTTKGAQAIASKIPQAAGVAPKVAGAGEIVTNTATITTGIKAIATFIKSPLGIGISITTLLSSGISGGKTARKDASSYIKNAGELMIKLKSEGMDNEADMLNQKILDLQDDFNTIIPYIPFLGSAFETNKIQDLVDELTKINLDYEEQKNINAQIAAAAGQTIVLGGDDDGGDDGDDYWIKLEEQRRYDEMQQALAYLMAYLSETKSEPASTLSFGLLRSGGETRLVHKRGPLPNGDYITEPDEVSRFYFNMPYVDLTEIQKKLVDMIVSGGIVAQTTL